MSAIAIAVGVFLVASVFLDLVNTLVTTHTHRGRFWLTSIVYRVTWSVNRRFAGISPSERLTNNLIANYAPITVLLMLGAWVTQQVVGFGLIWWGIGGIEGADGLFDAIYYSGVVYFTLGFGEVVPVDEIPRIGALIEAMSGVITTALVIGYLPALYAAYSERERKLLTLDDGSEDRIIPVNLIIARAPGADASLLLSYFADWEDWIAGILETHTAFPMLTLFRSKHHGQSWITALGLITDAALHCQLIVGVDNREPYWCIRRAIRLFAELTDGVDLSEYEAAYDAEVASIVVEPGDPEDPLYQIHLQLEAAGFELHPYEDVFDRTRELRRTYAPALEYMIDAYLAPRGFWGHAIGMRMEETAHITESP